MMKNNNPKVEIIDNDHVFVNNKQFVSLSRLAEAKMESSKEIKLLMDKTKCLAEENDALRTLLWNQYNGDDNTCASNVQDDTTNKVVTKKFSLNDYLNDIFNAYDAYLNTSNINDSCKSNMFTSAYCAECPNNPVNGGDGVCNCTLGQMQINY